MLAYSFYDYHYYSIIRIHELLVYISEQLIYHQLYHRFQRSEHILTISVGLTASMSPPPLETTTQPPQQVKIHQRGVQWKQGVVIYMMLSTPSDCTPPFDEYPAGVYVYMCTWTYISLSGAWRQTAHWQIPWCVYIHIYIYIYIYMYIERERDR